MLCQQIECDCWTVLDIMSKEAEGGERLHAWVGTVTCVFPTRLWAAQRLFLRIHQRPFNAILIYLSDLFLIVFLTRD